MVIKLYNKSIKNPSFLKNYIHIAYRVSREEKELEKEDWKNKSGNYPFLS